MSVYHKKMLLLLALSLSIFTAAVVAQAPIEEVKQDYPMSIRAVPTTLRIGEPLLLSIATTNRSGREMKSIPHHRFDTRTRPSGSYEIAVIDAEGKRTEIHPISPPIGEWAYTAKGDTYTVRQIHFRGPGLRLLWPEPGNYTIRLIPEDVYPSTNITVVTPEGRDAKAFELWKPYCTDKDESARGLAGHRLATEYLDTIYGQWALYHSTNNRWVGRLAPPEGWPEIDRTQPETAETVAKLEERVRIEEADMFERLRYLIEECPGFPVKDDCMVRLSRILRDKGDKREQYRAIISTYPDSPAARYAREELAKD